MDEPAPPLTPPAGFGHWPLTLLAVLTAIFSAFLSTHLSPYAGGADSAGYLSSARLLRHGELLAPVRQLTGHSPVEFGPIAFQPLGFLVRDASGWMVPSYPIGLPLHLVAAAMLVGSSHAVTLVNVVTSVVSGLLLFGLCRRLGISAPGALAGVVWLWLCPLYLFAALQPMSDLLAVGWSLATLYCALLARERWPWGFACGMAVAIAVLVRPTNLLLFAPVAVAVGWRPRAILAIGAAGLPGVLVFGYYNWRVYGAPLTTGYGDVTSAFSSQFVTHNLAHFSQWIPALLTPLILLACAAPFIRRARQRGFAMLAVWFAILTGFYAFYYHSGETWWYLRFILPAFPTAIIAALLVAETGWRALPARAWTPVLAGLVVLGAVGEIRQIRQLDILAIEPQERTYPDAAQWAQRHLPQKAAVFCLQVSGAFIYYTEFMVVRWDLVAPEKYPTLLTALVQAERPVYAALFPFESPGALEKIGGQWTKLATVGQVTFWRREP